MEIKDRISEFIQYKNITIAEFERNVSLANGYIKKFKGSIGSDKLSNIISYYPDININWLITGEGSMLKSENSNMVAEPLVEYGKKQTKPRIPYTAAAGSLTSAVEGITADQCEQIPRINIFPEYDFTIIIKGDSMEPKYEGGDEVACKRIDSTSFIQWGKVHVLDTAQGILIKRTYENGEKIRCVSYNPEYPDFSIDKSEIYSMSLVVGLVRL
ncbi:S24 family peptidase [Bacteroides cellulosilyticus]|uniref:S24 family peptidase n=1 Tax=Bacteroides cellulosilyticus TaxID=246787 RepID=UPI0018985509|nr:S24 family peptidase [Bacteroides cellulosilyticus]